ncbi:hypothetical protein ACFE04_007508 [Oxalis oulophora]
MKKPKSRTFKKQIRLNETEEIDLLSKWIDSQKPDSGTNPLSFSHSQPSSTTVTSSYPPFVGSTKFAQLPLSKRTKDGLRQTNYETMTDIQRATLPHSLCGRDILGASKTGSGKTLAFVVPVLEKLYKERWCPEFGVGSIIISPTRELASQIFDIVKAVGRRHDFSAGLLIGGRKDVTMEKDHVNDLNILVCTPGRLLQHMDETPNFDCSQLQVLVLDEADRILDIGFKKTLNAIISQLPKRRQTLLFSATQTKSIEDLARLSLKDPEYLNVHEESVTATPDRLQQKAMIVSLDQKLDMLWSFIKAHLNSKILVFLSTCKQVKLVYETFKKLRPGISLKCLHGRMSQERRMITYSQFCESRSVLFATDVASRGLDFDKAVDWVVQVDCPEDIKTYIHRVGRTARFVSCGRSILFLMPSEMKMLEHLQKAGIDMDIIKPNKTRLQPVTGLLSALLVKYPDMQPLAQKAFITYLQSIHLRKDKEIFDAKKLPIDEFSASLGLPMTPKVSFLKRKAKKEKSMPGENSLPVLDNSEKDDFSMIPKEELLVDDIMEDDLDEEFLRSKDTQHDGGQEMKNELEDVMPPTRILKKKKLKINIHRPTGTKVVFDDEGHTLEPFAAVANTISENVTLAEDKKNEFFNKIREKMKQADEEDKFVEKQRLKEKRMKKKRKDERIEEDSEEDLSGSEGEKASHKKQKNSKIYFDSDEEEGKQKGNKTDIVSLAEQEELALKLLSSMH